MSHRVVAWALAAYWLASASGAPVACAPDASLPCRNGGQCLLDSVVGTYCRCAAGLVGTYCELRANAVQITCTGAGLLVGYCTNGGICPTTPTAYCDCTAADTDGVNTWRGAHCEYPAVKCPGAPLWCLNGGNCTVGRSGTTTCACTPDWAGGSCQKLMSTALVTVVQPPKPGTVAVPTWVAAPIIFGLLMICMLCVAVALLIHREKKGRPVFQKLEPEAVTPTRRQQLTAWSAQEVGSSNNKAEREPAASTPGAFAIGQQPSTHGTASFAHPALFNDQGR